MVEEYQNRSVAHRISAVAAFTNQRIDRCRLLAANGAVQRTARSFEKPMSSGSDKDRIFPPNDDLRRLLYHGGVILTPGVAALGEEAIGYLANAIATFHDFCTATDPIGEHNSGIVDCDGTLVMFKIDYFARDFSFHSPDTADPAIAERVITIMLAEEH
jgi:Protein of unknown function (DUF3768)